VLKTAVFAPQFFLLLGVDFFLVGSIATIVFEERFPKAIPYILIVGSFVGFSQLMLGRDHVNAMDDAIQFYYCASFALVALASLIGLNLYLLFGRPEPMKKPVMVRGILFATALPIPAAAGLLFFASAYVNERVVTLPFLPVVPIAIVYVAVLGSLAVFCGVLFMSYLESEKGFRLRNRKRSVKKTSGNPSGKEEREEEEAEMGECPVCGTPSPLSAPRCPACGAEFDEGVDEDV
jgi:hypothetical protein